MSGSRTDTREGLRALAFASDDGATWGAAVPDGQGWSVVIGPAGGAWTAATGLDLAEDPDGSWRLGRDGDSAEDPVALRIVPEQPPVAPPAGAPDPSGEEPAVREPATREPAAREPAARESAARESAARLPPGAAFVPGAGPELCRLTGMLAGRSVDWWAVRMRLPAPRSARDEPGSLRLVAGWMADGSAFGLIAARSRRAERADQDVVSATLFDPESWLAASEPRLSTTYGPGEIPSRVNLELWVGEGEHEFARRAAGEASGAPVAAGGALGEGTVQVIPLRCHSRGEEGFGVYVLAIL
ncbi:MAG TPA: hypothetical protein VFN65_02595 [Solirubrobacteraceae bacterium]|nr:hypothetical protein [Solirubrobacteraceae bacterium]